MDPDMLKKYDTLVHKASVVMWLVNQIFYRYYIGVTSIKTNATTTHHLSKKAVP